MLYGRCQPSPHLHSRAMLLVWCLVFSALVFAQDTIAQDSFAQDTKTGSAPADAAFQRVVGAIKAIDAGGITLTADTGDEVHATLTDSTRIVRVAPGEKDLKNATPLQKQDLQIGDRILVRGRPGADAHSLAALAIIVMKQSDVAAKQQKEREDWQKRGVGGLVNAVDAATGTITVSQTSFAGTKSVVVHTSKSTILRH